MSEDLDALLNAYLDGALSEVKLVRLVPRLKEPAVARRVADLRALREALRAAAPDPGPERSRRMWAGVQARIASRERAVLDREPKAALWQALFTRPWAGAWGLGLAGALAASVWVFLALPRPGTLSPRAAALNPSVPAAPGSTRAVSTRVHAAPAGPSLPAEAARGAMAAVPPRPRSAGVAPATHLAGLLARPAPQRSPGLTEVQQALAANNVDDLADQFLAVQRQAPASVVGGMGASPFGNAAGGEDTVDYRQSTLVPNAGPASSTPGRPLGSKGGDGLWNWIPAARALNQRNWAQARVELSAASKHAGEAAERVFAQSALGLLSAPGEPLEGFQTGLPPVGSIRVLSAGTWQLLAGSHLARFGGGVSVRLPGLREDGDSFLLDLTFNQGQFAPGAHFVRVSGENFVRVISSDSKPVSSQDFYAPQGADYDFATRELRLR